MKTLCFALILSQTAQEDAAPPAHIQELLKKRILYQIKQRQPDRQFFFDESTCDVVGTYEYFDEAVSIRTNDKNLQLRFPYTDILAGKQLELSELQQSMETRSNIVAAVQAPLHANLALDSRTESSSSAVKKWLPWVIGAVALSLGGWAVYNSMERKGGSDPAPARRRR